MWSRLTNTPWKRRLILILVVVLGVRLVLFLSQNISYYWDETAMIVAAQSVLQSGSDLHGNPWWQVVYPSYGDYKLPVYIWSVTGLMKIFGPAWWVVRLPSFLAGLGSVGVAGWLAWLLMGDDRRAGKSWVLWVTAILGFAPWSLHFSQVGFEGHLGQMVVGLAAAVQLWGVRQSRQQPRLLASIGAAAIAAIAVYTYYSVRFVWPVLFLSIVFLYQVLPIFRSQLATRSWLLAFKQTLRRSGLVLLVGGLVFGGMLWPLQASSAAPAMTQLRLSTDSSVTQDKAVRSNNHW
jgi:4-amino-4-deoxy-L-arabinose transferase-like glycosyltransferase